MKLAPLLKSHSSRAVREIEKLRQTQGWKTKTVVHLDRLSLPQLNALIECVLSFTDADKPDFSHRLLTDAVDCLREVVPSVVNLLLSQRTADHRELAKSFWLLARICPCPILEYGTSPTSGLFLFTGVTRRAGVHGDADTWCLSSCQLVSGVPVAVDNHAFFEGGSELCISDILQAIGMRFLSSDSDMRDVTLNADLCGKYHTTGLRVTVRGSLVTDIGDELSAGKTRHKMPVDCYRPGVKKISAMADNYCVDDFDGSVVIDSNQTSLTQLKEIARLSKSSLWHESYKSLDVDSIDDLPANVASLIPQTSYVPVCGLRTGGRYYAHVSHLRESPYRPDSELIDKLVLSDDDSKLLKTISKSTVASRFTDFVDGKGIGRNVILVGPPGVGKTLIAESITESRGQPLYSVSCASLGFTAESVERSLRVVAERASRWNAALLIDDADAYISPRNENISQAAVTSVLLAFMERHEGWLYMTTNRTCGVDEAVKSRCLLRLTLDKPGVDYLARIWLSLCSYNSVNVDEALSIYLAESFPDLTGRDIGQVINLYLLVYGRDSEPTRENMTSLCRRFVE